MKTWMTVLMIAGAGAGCASDEDTLDLSVDAIRSLEPTLSMGAYQPALEVELVYPAINIDKCIRLADDLTFTVNGARMQVTDPGGVNPEEEDYVGCKSPKLALANVPAQAVTELVIADRTGSITCNLGNRMEARTLTMLDGTSFAPGAEVQASWSPATDLFYYDFTVLLRPTGGDFSTQIALDATEVEGVISFTLPASLAAGAYDLTTMVNGNGDGPPQLDCGLTGEFYFAVDRTQSITVR